MDMTRLTGGCLCGHVRYEVETDNKALSLCHCTHCQKVSGGAFSVNLFVEQAGLRYVASEPAVYADTAESGRTLRRLFCPRCGSSLASQSEMFPGKVVLKAGSLDDTSGLEPKVQIWTRSKQSWWRIDPTMTCFEKGRV